MLEREYLIKYKNGSSSRWNVREKNGNASVSTLYYDNNGYYVAAKSQDYAMPVEDLEANLRILKSIDAEVIGL